MTIKCMLEINPISVNKIFQGRRFKTREYKNWREEALLMLPKKQKIEGKVRVELIFYITNDKRRDLDNMVKSLLDAIVDKGYIEDDRKIYEMEVKKVNSNSNKVSIQIYAI